jgi:hypothetical protein
MDRTAEKARKPRLDYPRLRVARFSGLALTEGIESHGWRASRFASTRLRRPSPTASSTATNWASTFAVEALRDFSRRHRGDATELAGHARICRVSRDAVFVGTVVARPGQAETALAFEEGAAGPTPEADRAAGVDHELPRLGATR